MRTRPRQRLSALGSPRIAAERIRGRAAPIRRSRTSACVPATHLQAGKAPCPWASRASRPQGKSELHGAIHAEDLRASHRRRPRPPTCTQPAFGHRRPSPPACEARRRTRALGRIAGRPRGATNNPRRSSWASGSGRRSSSTRACMRSSRAAGGSATSR